MRTKISIKDLSGVGFMVRDLNDCTIAPNQTIEVSDSNSYDSIISSKDLYVAILTDVAVIVIDDTAIDKADSLVFMAGMVVDGQPIGVSVQSLNETAAANTSITLLSAAYFGGSNLSGGVVTPTGGIGFLVSTGHGYARNIAGQLIPVIWPAINASAAVDGDNFIAIDYTGSIVQTSTFSSADNIPIGYVRTTAANSVLIGFNSLNLPSANGQHQIGDWLRGTIGTLVERGCAVSTKLPPNDLEVVLSSGFLWALFNKLTISQTSVFVKIYTDNGENALIDSLLPNEINVTQWNDRSLSGTAALVDMTAGYYKKDLFFVTTEGTLFYAYASQEFLTEEEAIAAPLPELPESVRTTVARLAAIVTQKGSTSVSAVIDVRPIFSKMFVGTAAAPSTVVEHGDLAGLAADDHTQYHTDVRGDNRYYTKSISDLNYEPKNLNIQEHISNFKSGMFDATSTVVLYSDASISIRYDASIQQFQFSPTTLLEGWVGVSISKIDGNATRNVRGDADDIFTIVGNWYTFTDSGLRNANFDLENYGATCQCTVTDETDLVTNPTYYLSGGIGDITKGWFLLNIIK